MLTEKEISQNINTVKMQLQRISLAAKRPLDDVHLVAVSKFQPASHIQIAYQHGIRDFAENYVQEWKEKSEQLKHLTDIRWHFIGHLQKNKTKFIAPPLHCLQSLDSLTLARQLVKNWAYETPLEVLIQLQVDSLDINKSGVPFAQAEELLSYVLSCQCQKLKLRGFMGIGPQTADKEYLKDLFQRFVEHCHRLWPEKNKLISLGMTNDLDVATEAGSNMVRIGSAIFGKRQRQALPS